MSAHVDDSLLSCKSPDVVSKFKRDLLSRFIGTDEGVVTEYLGWSWFEIERPVLGIWCRQGTLSAFCVPLMCGRASLRPPHSSLLATERNLRVRAVRGVPCIHRSKFFLLIRLCMCVACV